MAVYGASRLAGCHPDLVSLVTSLGARRDLQVVQGARSYAEEVEAIRTHHSSLRDPWSSKHVVGDRRLLATAVDLGPHPLDWKNTAAFTALSQAMKSEAALVQIDGAWGADWATFKDYDHFKLKHA